MRTSSRSPFLVVILAVLLLLGEFGAVMHGYTHLSQQLHVSQPDDVQGKLHHHKAADKATFCDLCLAFADFSSGLLGHSAGVPLWVLIAVVTGFYLTSFNGRIRLAFRSRAPPVFS